MLRTMFSVKKRLCSVFGPFYRSSLSEDLIMQISFLSKVRHQNLVLLKGYCLECKKQLLVFEFMSGGSLKDHLYGKWPWLLWQMLIEYVYNGESTRWNWFVSLRAGVSTGSLSKVQPMSWEQRLTSALGAAAGIIQLKTLSPIFPSYPCQTERNVRWCILFRSGSDIDWIM